MNVRPPEIRVLWPDGTASRYARVDSGGGPAPLPPWPGEPALPPRPPRKCDVVETVAFCLLIFGPLAALAWAFWTAP